MQALLLLGQLPMALMVAYLDCLSVLATVWRRSPPDARRRRCFAVLIPAHNEERLLPRLLQSVAALDYPADLVDIHVVADNCTDGTVETASPREYPYPLRVHERHDEQLRGKGYALTWLLERLRASGEREYDAYVIVDADSLVSSNFLDVMNRHLERGDVAIQSYYGVANRSSSWASALRYAALALFNDLRPRGRDAVGLSAGLRGNGMCFAAETIRHFGWDSFALAEDAEFHLKLVEGGVAVSYAPEASVLGEMPESLRQAQSQNVRWERGRLQLLRLYGSRLLRRGLRRRDWAMLDALAEQLVPPLSLLTALTSLWAVISWIVGRRPARVLATAVLLGQTGYVLTGLRLVRAGAGTYLALLGAPLYIVWKVWIYLVAAAHLGDTRWVRTGRERPSS